MNPRHSFREGSFRGCSRPRLRHVRPTCPRGERGWLRHVWHVDTWWTGIESRSALSSVRVDRLLAPAMLPPLLVLQGEPREFGSPQIPRGRTAPRLHLGTLKTLLPFPERNLKCQCHASTRAITSLLPTTTGLYRCARNGSLRLPCGNLSARVRNVSNERSRSPISGRSSETRVTRVISSETGKRNGKSGEKPVSSESG